MLGEIEQKQGVKEVLMSEEPENGQKTQAEGQQQEPVPSSEQPAEETPGLPEDASERTREQFEKLTKKNQELAQKLEEFEKSKPQEKPKSVFDELRPSEQDYSHLDQHQVDQISSDFVDENGYVDVQRLNKALSEANRRAQEAIQMAQQAQQRAQKFEETEQQRRAFSKHPRLDPSNEQFDRRFHEAVRNEVIGQMMSGSGNVDLIGAADKVATFMGSSEKVSKAKEEAVQQYKETAAQKKQAQVQTSSGANSANPQEVTQKMQRGDRNAFAERLKASGF